MTIEIKFGDVFYRKYVIGMNIVFLHENRFGDMIFGTENGGNISMTRTHFESDLAKEKIVKVVK